MTTQRIKELFKEFNSNICFIHGNIDDLFCDRKFVLSNFDYQIFEFLKDYRTAFIDKNKVFFLDSKSYNSFLGNNIEKEYDKKLITFSNKELLLEQTFKKQFIRQLRFFIKEYIKTFYIINIENNDEIFNILSQENIEEHYFLIKVLDLNLLEKIIKKYNLQKYSIIELSNPKNDEIYNLLNRLRIKNNIDFKYELLHNLEINKLSNLYESIKDLKNTNINDILNKMKFEENKNNNIWIEF